MIFNVFHWKYQVAYFITNNKTNVLTQYFIITQKKIQNYSKQVHNNTPFTLESILTLYFFVFIYLFLLGELQENTQRNGGVPGSFMLIMISLR